MSKQQRQQPFPTKAIAHQSATRVVLVPFALAALIVLALWLHDPAVAQLVLLAAGLPSLLVMAFGALRIVAMSVRCGWRWPGRYGQRIDPHTGLLTGVALAELGQTLLERSQRRGKPFGVLVFDFDDRDEVKDLYSVRARQQILRLIGRKLRRLAGRKGLALRLTRSRFVVLLPDCTGALAQELATANCSFEFDSAQDELVLVPRLTAVCATAETDSVEELLLDLQAQSVYRPNVRLPAANPGFSAALLLSEPTKPKFGLPVAARLPNYSHFPPTFPMPLRARRRETHTVRESRLAA